MVSTWIDLVSYVRVRYEVLRSSEHTLNFELPTEDGRSQLVSVHHVSAERADGGEWVQISSPIARVDDVDLRRLLELAGQAVVGGAAIIDGVAVLRHAAPLAELSSSEFDRPFRLVTAAADRLERELTGGGDHF